MALKKTHIISAFLIFWIIFIGWGMLKTTSKLTKEKAMLKEKAKKVEQKVEQKEALPAPTPMQAEPAAIRVRTFKLKATDFKDILPVMGTVKGEKEIGLKFEVNGVVSAMNFREGDKVKKGQVVARLDPKDAILRLEYAKKKLASAESNYEMNKKRLQIIEGLHKAGAVIQLKLEEAQLEAQKARLEMETIKQEVEIAQRELEKTSLLAPQDGVIGAKDAEVGEFVTPQEKIASLVDIEKVFVEVGIIEKDIEKVKLGQKVEITVDAYSEQKFAGTVDNIFPVVEGKSRTLTVKVKAPNSEGLLLPGMFSRGDVFIAELKDSLIIPNTALVKLIPGVTIVPLVSYKEASQEEVEKGKKPGEIELRKVEVGYSTSDYVQITSGLSAGDLVVIESQGELKDGVKVKVVGVEEGTF